MLISSWLKSFRALLQTSPRRTRQRKVEKRWSASRRSEHLEARTLLTSPELVAISPNFGSFIDDGTILTERPNELRIQFTPGETLNGTTLGAIQISGSGFDGSFTEGNEIQIDPGFLGLDDTGSTAIFRFAESLPDDVYRITIVGSGATPLTNTTAEPFNNGEDLTIQFELDLGAQVEAVVPQPTVRDQVLQILNVGQIADGDQITINDGSGDVVFEFEDDAVNDGTGSNVPISFNSATSSTALAATIEAVVNTASFTGPGVTASANGGSITIQGNVFSPTITTSFGNSDAVGASEGGIHQIRDKVIVYFNEDPLNQTAAQEVQFYRLVNTANTLDPSDDLTTLPQTVTYDAANNRAILDFLNPIPTGTHTLRIGSSDEGNNTLALATPVGSLFNVTNFTESGYIGDVDEANDVDLYRVEVQAGTDLTITSTASGVLDTAIRLFDENGVELSNASITGPGAAEQIVFTVTTSGTYYVGVSSDGNTTYATDGTGNTGGTSTGSYTLDIDVTTPLDLANDNNSSFDTATDLGHSEHQGRFCPVRLNAKRSRRCRTIPVDLRNPGIGRTLLKITVRTLVNRVQEIELREPFERFLTISRISTRPAVRVHRCSTKSQKPKAAHARNLRSLLTGAGLLKFAKLESAGLRIITGDPRTVNRLRRET